MFHKDLGDSLHGSFLDVEKGTGHEGTLSQVAMLEHEPRYFLSSGFSLYIHASHTGSGSPSLHAHVDYRNSWWLALPSLSQGPHFHETSSTTIRLSLTYACVPPPHKPATKQSNSWHS